TPSVHDPVLIRRPSGCGGGHVVRDPIDLGVGAVARPWRHVALDRREVQRQRFLRPGSPPGQREIPLEPATPGEVPWDDGWSIILRVAPLETSSGGWTMADVRRITLDEVVRHFEDLEDPRCSINRKHPLVSVVVIAVMAVLAGASGPTAIARWAALKEEFLVAALDLPEGVPGKDVFRRVLLALRPEAFRACFVGWLGALRAEAAAAT